MARTRRRRNVDRHLVDHDGRTPAFHGAVAALRALAAQPHGDYSAAIGEFLIGQHEKILKEHGLRDGGGQITVWRLPGVLRPKGRLYDLNPSPPGTDHPRLVYFNGRPVVFVSEPYD